MSDQYYIWSNEHRRWWRAGSAGYARGLLFAGVYSRAEAIAICKRAIPGAPAIGMLTEIPVRVEDVREFIDGPGASHPCIWDGEREEADFIWPPVQS